MVFRAIYNIYYLFVYRCDVFAFSNKLSSSGLHVCGYPTKPSFIYVSSIYKQQLDMISNYSSLCKGKHINIWECNTIHRSEETILPRCKLVFDTA